VTPCGPTGCNELVYARGQIECCDEDAEPGEEYCHAHLEEHLEGQVDAANSYVLAEEYRTDEAYGWMTEGPDH